MTRQEHSISIMLQGIFIIKFHNIFSFKVLKLYTKKLSGLWKILYYYLHKGFWPGQKNHCISCFFYFYFSISHGLGKPVSMRFNTQRPKQWMYAHSPWKLPGDDKNVLLPVFNLEVE